MDFLSHFCGIFIDNNTDRGMGNMTLKLLTKKNIICFILLFLIIFFITMHQSKQIVDIVQINIEYQQHETVYQLFYDTGSGFNKKQVKTFKLNLNSDKTIKFELPKERLNKIRLDLGDKSQKIIINDIVFLKKNKCMLQLKANDLIKYFKPNKYIEDYKLENNKLVVRTLQGDPYIVSDLGFSIEDNFNNFKHNLFLIFKSIILSLGLTIMFIFWRSIKEFLAKIYKRILIKHNLVSLIIVMLIICIIVFWDFITLKKIYIFKDIGSDTYFQFYPSMHYYAKEITQLKIPTWSFSAGIGQDLYPGWLTDPFISLAILLGKDVMPYALVYSHILNILLSGILFSLYLKKINLYPLAVIIGSVLYSFSGHIIVRGTWYHYATEGFIIALALYAFEKYYQDENKLILPVAIFVLTTARLNVYYLFLYTLLFYLYSIMRYLMDNKFSIRKISIYLFNISKYYLLGILIGTVFWLPRLYKIFVGVYGLQLKSSVTKFTIDSIFSLNNVDVILTTILRFFSSDLMGVDNRFTGYSNYLEAPLFYCGLLTLLLSFQIVILEHNKKHKLIYILQYLLIGMYLIFPFARYALNGFSGYYYKISSFWIIVSLVVMAMKSLTIIIKENKLSKCIHVIIGIAIGIIGILVIVSKSFNLTILNIKLAYYIMGILLLYFIILNALVKLNKERYLIKLSLLLLVIIEVTSLSYVSINFRSGALNNENFKTKTGYNDYTLDAINYLSSIDNGFYRLEKDFNSVFFNDSMYQGYNGLKHYGDNHLSYLYFLNKMDVGLWRGSNKYVSGVENRLNLETLLGVKYYLSKGNRQYTPDIFKQVARFGNIAVYKNQFYLPLGFTYNKYIYDEQIINCKKEIKDDIILDSVILEKDVMDEKFAKELSKLQKMELKDYQANSDYKIQISKNKLTYNNITLLNNEFPQKLEFIAKNNDPMIILPIENGKFNTFNISLDIHSKNATMGQIFYRTNKTNFNEKDSVRFKIKPGLNHYNLDINSINELITAIRLDIGNNIGEYSILNLSITGIDQSNKIYTYKEKIKERRKDAFQILNFNQDYIKGYIKLDSSKILFLSIPYDENWELYVDGERIKFYRVNYGFIGAVLPKGKHDVVLKYQTPMLREGCIISIIGILLYLTIFLKSKLINVRRRIR